MACTRAEIDLTACEGATFSKTFVWKTGSPAEAVDLTGYTGECHIRDKITDDVPDFILENAVGVIILDQTETPGGYQMYIAAEDTQGECPGNKRRKMVYDLALTDASGVVRMQQYGKFNLEPAVTRPWELTP